MSGTEPFHFSNPTVGAKQTHKAAQGPNLATVVPVTYKSDTKDCVLNGVKGKSAPLTNSGSKLSTFLAELIQSRQESSAEESSGGCGMWW